MRFGTYLVVRLDVQLDFLAGEGADSGRLLALRGWWCCRRGKAYLICMVVDVCVALCLVADLSDGLDADGLDCESGGESGDVWWAAEDASLRA